MSAAPDLFRGTLRPRSPTGGGRIVGAVSPNRGYLQSVAQTDVDLPLVSLDRRDGGGALRVAHRWRVSNNNDYG
jgi:hypothetical protein